jgi:hypothetical protein
VVVAALLVELAAVRQDMEAPQLQYQVPNISQEIRRHVLVYKQDDNYVCCLAHSFSMTYLLSIAVGLEMQDMWFKIRREKAIRDSQASAW